MNVKKECLTDGIDIFSKIANFVLPRSTDSGKKLSEEILIGLIKNELYRSKSGLTTKEIVNSIKSQLGISFELYEIGATLRKLVESSQVIKTGKNKRYFSLDVREAQKLKKGLAERESFGDSIFAKFNTELKNKYDGLLSEDEVTQIVEDFKKLLYIFFLLAGAESAYLLHRDSDVPSLMYRTKEKGLFSYLSHNEERILQIEKKEFFPFLTSLTKNEKEYLQELLERSFAYHVLTVDKECEEILVSNFDGWKLFIDTNFIYNLLGVEPHYKEARRRSAESILELGKRAGIKFVISPMTIEEFQNSVSGAQDILQKSWSDELYDVSGEFVTNPLLQSYIKEKQKYASLTPEDFLAKIDNVKSILEQYGIQEDKSHYRSIREDGIDELEKMKEQFVALTHKTEYTATHDAFHFLLITKLRQLTHTNESVFTDVKDWFLTQDNQLQYFDKRYRGAQIIPFAIKPYQIRQILTPLFSRVEDFEASFVDFLSEPHVDLESPVKTNIVIAVLDRVDYYKKEIGMDNSAQIARSILMNQHFQKELREMIEKDSGEQVQIMVDHEIRRAITETSPKFIREERDNSEFQNKILRWIIAGLLLSIHIVISSYVFFYKSIWIWEHKLISIALSIAVPALIFMIPFGKNRVYAFMEETPIFVGKCKKFALSLLLLNQEKDS